MQFVVSMTEEGTVNRESPVGTRVCVKPTVH